MLHSFTTRVARRCAQDLDWLGRFVNCVQERVSFASETGEREKEVASFFDVPKGSKAREGGWNRWMPPNPIMRRVVAATGSFPRARLCSCSSPFDAAAAAERCPSAARHGSGRRARRAGRAAPAERTPRQRAPHEEIRAATRGARQSWLLWAGDPEAVAAVAWWRRPGALWLVTRLMWRSGRAPPARARVGIR